MYQPRHPTDPHQPEVYLQPYFTPNTMDRGNSAAADSHSPPPPPRPVTIRDHRTELEFRLVTFSKFKRTDVRRELMQAMLKKNVEEAIYWASEMLCAGHQAELWEIFSLFISRQVVNANPKLMLYLSMRRDTFQGIVKKEKLEYPLEYRNSVSIRKLFAEIAAILCFSPKRPTYEFVKIKREEEFDLRTWTDKLKAPNHHFVGPCFREDDPREVFIPANEFAYAIHSKDIMNSCYWIEWILEFDAWCRKKREKIECDCRRGPIPFKLQTEVVWLFWEILLRQAYSLDPRTGTFSAFVGGGAGASGRRRPAHQKKQHTTFDIKLDDDDECDGNTFGGGESDPVDEFTTKIFPNDHFYVRSIKALLAMFCWDYTSFTFAKKRKALLYHAAFSLIESPVNTNIPIIQERGEVEFVVQEINSIFREIAKNSERRRGFTQTSYLHAHDHDGDGRDDDDDDDDQDPEYMEELQRQKEEETRRKQILPYEFHHHHQPPPPSDPRFYHPHPPPLPPRTPNVFGHEFSDDDI